MVVTWAMSRKNLFMRKPVPEKTTCSWKPVHEKTFMRKPVHENLFMRKPVQEKTCSWENLFMRKPVHALCRQQRRRLACTLHSLISSFIVRSQESIIPVDAIPEIPRLTSLCSWSGQFESHLVANPRKQVFSCHGSLNTADQLLHMRKWLFSRQSAGVSANRYFWIWFTIIWATSWENLLVPYANKKDADQPAHPCSLISAYVVPCLDSIH